MALHASSRTSQQLCTLSTRPFPSVVAVRPGRLRLQAGFRQFRVTRHWRLLRDQTITKPDHRSSSPSLIPSKAHPDAPVFLAIGSSHRQATLEYASRHTDARCKGGVVGRGFPPVILGRPLGSFRRVDLGCMGRHHAHLLVASSRQSNAALDNPGRLSVGVVRSGWKYGCLTPLFCRRRPNSRVQESGPARPFDSPHQPHPLFTHTCLVH